MKRDLDRNSILALDHLQERRYQDALKTGLASTSSKGLGAAALAAWALASNADNWEDMLSYVTIEVSIALECDEEIPKSKAAFDAWKAGVKYREAGDVNRATLCQLAAVKLGKDSFSIVEGRDGFEFGTSVLGINATDDDGRLLPSEDVDKAIKLLDITP